jgi:hypothetical protein
MTREDANKKLIEMFPDIPEDSGDLLIDDDGDLFIDGYFKSKDLRAIADILDQVSKEPA